MIMLRASAAESCRGSGAFVVTAATRDEAPYRETRLEVIHHRSCREVPDATDLDNRGARTRIEHARAAAEQDTKGARVELEPHHERQADESTTPRSASHALEPHRESRADDEYDTKERGVVRLSHTMARVELERHHESRADESTKRESCASEPHHESRADDEHDTRSARVVRLRATP